MRAYRVAYDGRRFHGFQRQPDVPTVEDTLFSALRELDVLAAGADKPAGYAAAGRTDAGVSALAQTVAFDAPDWLSPTAFGAELPDEVCVWASADAPAGFHATHDATRRRYTYFLHAPEPTVSDERARAAFEALRGEHDFHNLTPDDEGTVRTLDGRLERDGDFLVVRLEADGFARQLVRRVVSLVAAVARGERDHSFVARVLGDDPLPGPDGISPAPPYPLALTDVAYPALSFERDIEATATAREAFGRQQAEYAARARVADHIVDGL